MGQSQTKLRGTKKHCDTLAVRWWVLSLHFITMSPEFTTFTWFTTDGWMSEGATGPLDPLWRDLTRWEGV
jgi:hypothetical protein